MAEERKSLLSDFGFAPPLPEAEAMEKVYKEAKREAVAGTEFEPLGPRTPTLGEAAQAMAPTIGGIVGGIFGSMLAPQTIPAKIAGSALGSFAGGTVGGTAQQKPSGSVMEQVLPEMVRPEVLGEGLKQAGLDIVGSGIGYGLGAGVRGLRKAVTGPITVNPEAREAQAFLRNYGASLTAGQATESGIYSKMEPLIRSSFAGKATFEEVGTKTKTALDRAATEIMTGPRWRGSYIDKGRAFLEALEAGNKGLKTWAEKNYGALDKEISNKASGLTLNVSNMRQAAVRTLEDAEIYKTLNPKQKQYLNDIANLPNQIPFDKAQQLRSRFLKESRDLEKSIDPNTGAVRTLGGIIDGLNSKMEAKLLDVDPNLAQMYKDINSFYAASKSDLKGRDFFISKLVEKHPEEIGASIFEQGNKIGMFEDATKALQRAAKLDKSVKYQERLKDMQYGYLERFLTKQTTDVSGDMIGHRILKELSDPEFQEAMKVILTPAQRSQLEKLAVASKLTQTKPKEAFSVLMPILQASAIGTLGGYAIAGGENASLVGIGGAAGLLIGPKFMARLLTSPKLVNRLVDGVTQIRSGLGVSSAIIAKLSANMKEEGLDQIFIEENQGLQRKSLLQQERTMEAPMLSPDLGNIPPEVQAGRDKLANEIRAREGAQPVEALKNYGNLRKEVQ